MTSAVIRSRTRTARIDQVCADATDLARDALLVSIPEAADSVGKHTEAVAEGERLVTHFYECLLAGYRGWHWSVTVTRISRSKHVTVCETTLLPGPDALTTPEWVPWNERIQAGDVGVGDLLPTAPDDDRLAPAYVLSDDPAVEEVSWEIGLGRPRVLSRTGRLDAAQRWYEGEHGPNAPIAKAAPDNAQCAGCGFFLPLAGLLRQDFGVCSNEYAADDGKVVTGDHGCGAFSELFVETPVEPEPTGPAYDDSALDEL
ncbi:hypothetical protein Lfu02_29590 [Longispora fulva]|uniref:DUF3027 family protein n=1 Tax=Longispora fulva TaxID=619741 RepID=A0A8J7GV55_9ACTN|nr:DUF3027 domain-containing protein [Longispora fulva]MBG6139094.1 hypothetical protein [Longispora fulva]GIG58587.1 hypothetical protein Lfu02_29590 [Longispora fulva]